MIYIERKSAGHPETEGLGAVTFTAEVYECNGANGRRAGQPGVDGTRPDGRLPGMI